MLLEAFVNLSQTFHHQHGWASIAKCLVAGIGAGPIGGGKLPLLKPFVNFGPRGEGPGVLGAMGDRPSVFGERSFPVLRHSVHVADAGPGCRVTREELVARRLIADDM